MSETPISTSANVTTFVPPLPKERARVTYDQARRITNRFGGPARLAELLGLTRMAVYLWNYPKPKGGDGLIPKSRIEDVMRAARMEGLLLTDKDWAPQRINYDITVEELFS